MTQTIHRCCSGTPRASRLPTIPQSLVALSLSSSLLTILGCLKAICTRMVAEQNQMPRRLFRKAAASEEANQTLPHTLSL